jgi:hypothetical protein
MKEKGSMMRKNTKLAARLAMSAIVAALTLTIQEMPALHASLTRDGQVQIEGDDGWTTILAQFDGLFLKTHPNLGRRLPLVLKASSGAMSRFEMGISASAP